MDFLPIFLNLTGQRCLIVGGGSVAARKAALLCRAGGKVTVLSPAICDPLRERVAAGGVEWREKPFAPDDVEGFRLVIAATDQRVVNEAVSQASQSRHIPVNVVDCPELCSFIFPAIVDRSPVIAAISSGGASPVLARLLRMRIESLIPPAYGTLARLAERYRKRVRKMIGDSDRRRRFWEQALQGSAAELVLCGREEEAAQHLERQLRAEADVVVYDRLVSPEIMQLVRRDAEKIYAGKRRSQHTLPQESINKLLAELAKAGKRVVRLKGGDPFIFGRGGEEIETLMEQGVHFQVVPGITAASGCAAYAGIPLTHRDYAQSCTFVTGHFKDGSAIELDWRRLAAPRQTLVIYMGLQGLDHICASLIRHGCAPDLPAALIQQGTTRHQVVLTGTLQSLPGLVSQSDVKAPTLAIIGEVVRLHQKLAWFRTEMKPG